MNDKKNYTVVGVYLCNCQPWIEHVEAEDQPTAAFLALSGHIQTDYPSGRAAIVAIIEGTHENVFGNESLICYSGADKNFFEVIS